MLGYRRNDLIVDGSIIFFSIIMTFLLRYTLLLQDYFLSLFLKTMIYLIDASAFLATFIALTAKGSLIVFYLFRVIGLAYAQGVELHQTVAIPILGYILFKVGCGGVNKLLGLSEVLPSEQAITEQLKLKQQTRRMGCICVFAVTGLFVFSLSADYPLLPTLTASLSMLFLCFDLFRLSRAQDYQSRLISNTLHFNVYLLIVANLVLGRICHGSWLFHGDATVAYLLFIFILGRLAIAARSYKFHNDDRDIFQAFYPFSHQQTHRKYISNDKFNRNSRATDRVARKIGVLAYFIATALAAEGRGHLWLLLSTIVITNYKVENSEDHPLAVLQSKLRLKVRSELTVPLLMLAWSVQKEVQCTKDIIYGVVSGCSSHSTNQLLFVSALLMGLGLSQLISDRKLRVKMEKAVAFGCSLVIFMVLFGLECQSSQQALLVFYTLCLCCVVIRDDRMAVGKGTKKY